MFYANNDIPLIYFFQFSSYSLAPMPSSKNILVMAKKIFAIVKTSICSYQRDLVMVKNFVCDCQKKFLSLSKKIFVIVK